MPYRSLGNGKYGFDWKAYGTSVLEQSVKVICPGQIKIGNDCYIGHDVMLIGYPLLNARSIEIGDKCWIGHKTIINGHGGVLIEKGVGIGESVIISTSSHDVDGEHLYLIRNQIQFKPVRLCEGCDIGHGAIIMPGVTIGKGAQVGAGSIVTKDVESLQIVVGNPASPLRKRASF